MKKLIFLIAICSVCSAAAQTVSVDKKSEKIKGETAEGYRTSLDGKKEDVAASWSRFLKELGRPKSGSDYQFIEKPAMGGTVYTSGIVYAQTSGNAEKSTVWLGIKAAEWTVNDISVVEKELEKLVYQFGVQFYRGQIQKQIDEAQRALDAVVRQQNRLVTQSKELVIKLSNNEQEKVQLDKNLQSNALEHLVVLQKIENNKKSQDSVALAGEQIKKVVELHKERQRKVN